MLEANSHRSWEVIHENEFKKRKPKTITPTPINNEIILDKDKLLISYTNVKGIITYCNDDFVTVSEYEEWELAGSDHNIVRHPDMPKFIFKFMWQRIQNGDNIIAIVKNLSKYGKYYWVMTDFVIKRDSQDNITCYKAYRKAVPRKAIETLAPLYKKLCRIEEAKGVSASESFFVGYLDTLSTTYDEFIEKLIMDDSIKEKTKKLSPTSKTKTEPKSFFKRLFDFEY